MISDLTVCVTSFGRAKYLARAMDSVEKTGIRNVVVSTMAPDEDIRRVLKVYGPTVSVIDHDLGCHENWIQAAYRSPTKRMILLHDDDTLSPELGKTYIETIKPAMDSGRAQWCTWRANLLFDDGTIRPTEWMSKETGVYPSGIVRDFLLRMGRLSLSPIISIFDRDVLIHALKEGGHYLTRHEECLYRPGMLLGTEIVAYLRHAANMGKWMFVNQVLSSYGACESSGTVAAQKTGNLRPLTIGYDRARKYFTEGHFAKPVLEPRIIFVYDDVPARDEDEQRRFNYAYGTWRFHFNQADMLEFPTSVRAMPRSSTEIGDPRPVPYFKDLIDYGANYARPEDIIVYANRDICLTTGAPERIIKACHENGVAVAWRRNFKPEAGRSYKHSTHAKRDGGVDLVAVTPAWWRSHRDLMPDMFIGRECWDWAFRTLAEERGGKSIYVDDVVYHEPHTGQYWAQNKKTNPAQIHNRNLARVFFARRKDRRALMSLQ